MRSFIEGTQIDLRPLTMDDVKEGYVNWFNDSAVCAFNRHHAFPYTEALARQYVEGLQTGNQNLVLAIIDKASGRHIGNVSLQAIDWMSRNAEFAIILGEREWWGKGIGAEASKMMVEHGFKVLNLHRIYCFTPTANVPMRKIAERLGFEEEGIQKEALYKDGMFHDVVAYGLINKQ